MIMYVYALGYLETVTRKLEVASIVGKPRSTLNLSKVISQLTYSVMKTVLCALTAGKAFITREAAGK